MPSVPMIRRVRLAAALSLLAAGAGPAAWAAPLLIASGSGNSLGPALSDDGRHLAFYSAADLTGGNADNNFEIFVFDRQTGQTRQVTNDPRGISHVSQVPSISGDGSRLVYQRFEPGPGGTALVRSETVDLRTGTTTTLPTVPGFSEATRISRDGGTIAVHKDNTGLRLYDVASGTLGPVLAGNTASQAIDDAARRAVLGSFSGAVSVLDLLSGSTTLVASSGSFNPRPTLSGDGRLVAFSGTFDPLGTNADRNEEIFLYDVAGASLRQLTQTTGSSSRSADLDGNGTRLAFLSNADLTGGNAARNTEVFVADLITGALSQLSTVADGQKAEVTISHDGNVVAFSSFFRSGGSRIYLADLDPRPPAVPEPASLLLVATAVLGLLAAGRRGKVGGVATAHPAHAPRDPAQRLRHALCRPHPARPVDAPA